MTNYQNLLKRIFLKDDEKFFHGLSFVILSLIAINAILYFNFYKFSSNWIDQESRKTTFIISTLENERDIPLTVKENIFSSLREKFHENSFKVIDSGLIQESLGLENLNTFSSIGMPLIFQILVEDKKLELIEDKIKTISGERVIEKYAHRDELYEIAIIINRIKFFIFFMFAMVSILFAFLITTMIKAALLVNFKFLEMIQIMGASSIDIAKSISLMIVKKIMPGSFLSLIFVFVVFTTSAQVLGLSSNFFSSSFFFDLNIKNFIVLVLFLIFFLIVLLIYLTSYLFYFFEKRFFDEI